MVNAYVYRWKALGRTCAGILFRIKHLNRPLVGYSDEVEYVRRLSDLLQKGKDTGTLDLTECCLRKPFDSSYPMRDSEEYK